MDEHNSHEHKNSFIHAAITIVLFTLSALFFVISTAVIYNSKENANSHNSGWALALFLIPLFIYGVGALFIHQKSRIVLDELNNQERRKLTATRATYQKIHNTIKKLERRKKGIVYYCYFYNITMMLSVVWYCFAWLTYSFKRWLVFSSGYCLVGILVQFSIIIIATFIIMKGSNEFLRRENAYLTRLGDTISFLKTGFASFAFWRIAHFFVVFMSISFLFGFAFAFHDIIYRDSGSLNPALYIENLASDEVPEKKAKALEILNRAKNGEDFAALAKEFSEDSDTKDKGGLYQDTATRELLPEFEQAALALEPGQVAPNLLETKLGYHIIKLEKKSDEVKDNDGLTKQTYDVRNILFLTTNKTDHLMKREKPAQNLLSTASAKTPAPFYFYFESGKANISAEDRDKTLKETTSINDNEKKEFIRQNKNYKSFNALLLEIEQKKLQGIPRVTLIGRADELSAGKLYPSNYDLSEARTQTMRNEITKRLYEKDKEWQNIDWILVAYSNENSVNSDKRLDLNSDEYSSLKPPVKEVGSGKRVVEAYLSVVSRDVQSPQTKEFWEKQTKESEKNKYKQPNLMDYMYFSIYTITTTGYGDIKPATRYSKFLVSLENFFEVFFLVCFMNTLIALKSERYRD